jgi:hypothetical protein
MPPGHCLVRLVPNGAAKAGLQPPPGCFPWCLWPVQPPHLAQCTVALNRRLQWLLAVLGCDCLPWSVFRAIGPAAVPMLGLLVCIGGVLLWSCSVNLIVI